MRSSVHLRLQVCSWKMRFRCSRRPTAGQRPRGSPGSSWKIDSRPASRSMVPWRASIAGTGNRNRRRMDMHDQDRRTTLRGRGGPHSGTAPLRRTRNRGHGADGRKRDLPGLAARAGPGPRTGELIVARWLIGLHGKTPGEATVLRPPESETTPAAAGFRALIPATNPLLRRTRHPRRTSQHPLPATPRKA